MQQKNIECTTIAIIFQFFVLIIVLLLSLIIVLVFSFFAQVLTLSIDQSLSINWSIAFVCNWYIRYAMQIIFMHQNRDHINLSHIIHHCFQSIWMFCNTCMFLWICVLLPFLIGVRIMHLTVLCLNESNFLSTHQWFEIFGALRGHV